MTWLLLVVQLSVSLAQAAPHPKFPQKVERAQVTQLLSSTENTETIKKLGPQGYQHLQDIMLSEKATVDQRWNATLTLAKIGGSESRPEIQRALGHPEWFMRAAGLLSMSLIEKDHGLRKAKEMMSSDPALLVRATALQLIAQREQLDRDYLWKEIYNPLNFNHGQSLSLRASILRVLAKNAKKNEAQKFMALMREGSSDIQGIAKRTLETVFKHKIAGHLSSPKQMATRAE